MTQRLQSSLAASRLAGSILLLAGTAVAQGYALGTFEPLSLNLGTTPIECRIAYNSPLQGCQRSDFARDATCSSACLRGVEQMQDNIQTACNTVTVPVNTLLGQAFLGNLPQVLCPGAPGQGDGDTVTTATTTTRRPQTTATVPSTTQRETPTTLTTTASTTRATTAQESTTTTPPVVPPSPSPSDDEVAEDDDDDDEDEDEDLEPTPTSTEEEAPPPTQTDRPAETDDQNEQDEDGDEAWPPSNNGDVLDFFSDASASVSLAPATLNTLALLAGLSYMAW